jgi:preprotein translocase subunit SecG
MSLLIGFLTVILVLNCLLLILLILIQLPKKEAGAGIAFGGGATDALFGAGSGTALTKLTKYCAGLFLGLSLILSVVNAQRVGRSNASLAEELKKKAAAARSATLVATNTPAATTSAAPFTMMQNTNAAAATNPAPAPGK